MKGSGAKQGKLWRSFKATSTSAVTLHVTPIQKSSLATKTRRAGLVRRKVCCQQALALALLAIIAFISLVESTDLEPHIPLPERPGMSLPLLRPGLSSPLLFVLVWSMKLSLLYLRSTVSSRCCGFEAEDISGRHCAGRIHLVSRPIEQSVQRCCHCYAPLPA